MVLSVLFGTLLLLFVQADAADVRYNIDGSWHTYTDDYPFTMSPYRPISALPESPSTMQTEFRLFTRSNRYSYQSIWYDSVGSSKFQSSKKTKFIVHGFTEDANSQWMNDLKNSILNVEDCNVILVGWGGGSDAPEYPQASANTQVVGDQIAALIRRLVNAGARESDCHIIGHSLGSHIAGYAGAGLTSFGRASLGRITGLDPAHPYFQDTPNVVRLDPGDAVFVDAIHTDGDPFVEMGWGMSQAVGHVDFYPNGGYDQPGCPGNTVDNGEWWKVICSHSRAHELMIDSIDDHTNYPMYGTQCSSYDTYEKGSCRFNPSLEMGYYADVYGSNNQQNVHYYLTTGSHEPYAVY